MRPALRKTAAALAALAGLAVLAGCEAQRQEPLFPLDGGRRWEYSVTTTFEDPAYPEQHERLRIQSDGSWLLAGQPAWRRMSDTGVAYWLRSDDTGVFRVATRGPLDPAPRSDPPGRYVLRKPFVAGTSWEAETVPYVMQRRNEWPHELRYLERFRSVTMKYSIEQLGQPVKTAAGSFAGCMVVQGVAYLRLYVDEMLAYRDVPITTREWYCPDVGLVRQERTERAPTKFLVGGSQVLELTAWR